MGLDGVGRMLRFAPVSDKAACRLGVSIIKKSLTSAGVELVQGLQPQTCIRYPECTGHDCEGDRICSCESRGPPPPACSLRLHPVRLHPACRLEPYTASYYSFCLPRRSRRVELNGPPATVSSDYRLTRSSWSVFTASSKTTAPRLVTGKMVFCTYCGQSFTRDEHLERHILTRRWMDTHCRTTLSTSCADIPRSDTNVKPFKCFTCHMSFARRFVRPYAAVLNSWMGTDPTVGISCKGTTPSTGKIRTRNLYPRPMA